MRPVVLQVLVIAESGIFTEGVCRLLRESKGFSDVEVIRGVDQALRRIERRRPDVVLVLSNVRAPAQQSETLHELQEAFPDLPVVLLLERADRDAMAAAIQAGAAGCFDRTADAATLCRGLEEAARGDLAVSDRLLRQLARGLLGRDSCGWYTEPLTPRERQVLGQLAAGLTNREIAQSLSVSESTVRAHLRTVSQKLGVQNRVQAVAKAVRLGLLLDAPPA